MAFFQATQLGWLGLVVATGLEEKEAMLVTEPDPWELLNL